MIELTREGKAAVLKLAHGKANAMDTGLMLELTDALRQVERSDAGALVLTGQGSVFSAGVDLVQLLSGGRKYIAEFLPRMCEGFRALYEFPKPAVAAVNGHAIAGGMILSSACDYRIMARGARIGIPELRVGVPFPLVALEIVRSALSPERAAEAVLFGRVLDADQAQRAGYVQEVVESVDVLTRALDRAEELASAPAGSFRKAKLDLRRPTLELLDRTESVSDAHLVDAWSSPAIQAAIRSYVEKTLKK
ncbi:MAG TPA: enoyl-CoA hydratase/isomerase family protein [Candidatus Eisenbacteria bacterium]|jgi:enoyl-CoA hydratase|nr:enoyl-CoA hydratase/isomerase family protein [Candidatus Eisenbacteria bacterium]